MADIQSDCSTALRARRSNAIGRLLKYLTRQREGRQLSQGRLDGMQEADSTSIRPEDSASTHSHGRACVPSAGVCSLNGRA